MTIFAPMAILLALMGAASAGSSNMECKAVVNLDGQSLGPIRETFDTWRETLRSADLEALGELVVEDAEFWTHSQPALHGRATMRAAMAPLFEEWTLDQEFACDELIVSGDLAVARGTEINRLTPRDGGESVVRRQRAFSVLLRGDDGIWRFARGMTIPAPDGPQEPGSDSAGV
jgi:uncharacterized protein (TIGR02246 family)